MVPLLFIVQFDLNASLLRLTRDGSVGEKEVRGGRQRENEETVGREIFV